MATKPPPPRSGAKLLVAEDNTVNQKVAAALLKQLGYQVDVVANGTEAVEAVARVPYDAILMDCQMPEMNGYEATAEIRRLESPGRHVPIIALTASAMKGDEERCLEAGMDAYVTKPITVDALGGVLAGLLAGPATGGVLDRKMLDSLRMMGGDTSAFLEEPADMFIDAVPADIAALNDAIANAELPAAAMVAHSLKGSCAAVGATRMGGLALEAAPIEHRFDRAIDAVALIAPAFEEVRAALRVAEGDEALAARNPSGVR